VSAAFGKKLHLSFHGRIIDSLGIQMYQSPVAAVAELIANAWDADATRVDVTLPADNSPAAQFIVQDNGTGMTFAECQERYLNVGRNRRLADDERTPQGRPLLGRKGGRDSRPSVATPEGPDSAQSGLSIPGPKERKT
jgi:Histidine kinase-, DNA gyrase B-, and HSP90-like ATPase